jgi:hypothetical protein
MQALITQHDITSHLERRYARGTVVWPYLVPVAERVYQRYGRRPK